MTQIATTQDYHTEVLTRHSAMLEHHSEILKRHAKLLEQIRDIQKNQGARLNVIDGRLALIERHRGMVKA